MANSTSPRTHGIVGKAWTVGNDIFNIIAVDQTELTVDAVEKSWTFHEQKDFDQFIRSLKPIISSPSVVLNPAPAAKATTTASAELKKPQPPVSAEQVVQEQHPAMPKDEPVLPFSGLELTAPNVNSNDPLAYMKGVLMETMERLRKDKNYVAQAKGITTAAASFTNLVAMEMKIRKGQ